MKFAKTLILEFEASQKVNGDIELKVHILSSVPPSSRAFPTVHVEMAKSFHGPVT